MPTWEELYVDSVDTDADRGQPLGLRQTPGCLSISALDGLVAQDFGGLNAVITSPNDTEVPQFPHISGRRIVIRDDGMWGPQEYSRWPQQYHPDLIHHACIPRAPVTDSTGPGPCIWTPLSLEQFYAPEDTWPRGYGHVVADVYTELEHEATLAIARFTQTDGPPSRKTHGNFLVNLLLHAVQRLEKVPSSFLQALVLVGQIQRIVLELSGLYTYLRVVRPRLLDPTIRNSDPLTLRGVFLNSHADAQEFFRVGIPFWLIQTYSPHIVIREVVQSARPVSSSLSLQPAFPVLEDARHVGGQAYQDPSRWPLTSLIHTAEEVIGCRLPSAAPPPPDPTPDSSSQPQEKRARVDDSVSRATPKSNAPKKTRRGKRARGEKPRPPHPALKYLPPPENLVALPASWARALAAAPPLPDTPPIAAAYYFPPPFVLVDMDDKTGRYAHNWLRLRTFARQRLVDLTIDGEPLRIGEWRDALYGEYAVPEDVAPAQEKTYTKAQSATYTRKLGLRCLFANAGGLPSYDPGCTREWRGAPVTAERARTDTALRAELLWELHEVNWRCELRDLDRLMLGDRAGGAEETFLKWDRLGAVARVWGGRGGLSVFPRYPDAPAPDLWGKTPSEVLTARRDRLGALIDVLSRWPGCPQELWQFQKDKMNKADLETVLKGEEEAVGFYVRCFTLRFSRLPVSPCFPPTHNS